MSIIIEKCNISTYTVILFPAKVRSPIMIMEIKSSVKLWGRDSVSIIIEKCYISTYTVIMFPAKVRLPVTNSFSEVVRSPLNSNYHITQYFYLYCNSVSHQGAFTSQEYGN